MNGKNRRVWRKKISHRKIERDKEEEREERYRKCGGCVAAMLQYRVWIWPTAVWTDIAATS